MRHFLRMQMSERGQRLLAPASERIDAQVERRAGGERLRFGHRVGAEGA